MIRQGAPTRGRRPPSRWELRQEAEKRERQRLLAELTADLRHAAETEAEWYVWIRDGRPLLTEAEYALVGRNTSPRNRSTGSPRNRGEESSSTDDRPAQGTLA